MNDGLFMDDVMPMMCLCKWVLELVDWLKGLFNICIAYVCVFAMRRYMFVYLQGDDITLSTYN